MSTLSLSRRSVRFIKIYGYVIRVILLLDVDDADSLSRRSASLCDELLPLLSTFASSQFRGGAFSPADGDSTSITTVTESLTVKFTLRNLLAGITLLTINGRSRSGVVLSPEAAAQFEIVASIADRKAAAARTTTALGLGSSAAVSGGGGKKTTAAVAAVATKPTTTSIKRAKVKTTIVL